MSTVHHVRLTSSEIANLWTQYMNDSASLCFIQHFLDTVQGPEVRDIVEQSRTLSSSHLLKVKHFLKEERYPIPQGFSEEDVINKHAPALFSDAFVLNYFYVMSIIGLTGYSGALATSVRSDQRAHFIHCQTEAMELYDKVVELMLQQGIFVRPPNINAPEGIDFVEKQSYLTGWIGKKRPLNAIEMSGIYYNMAKLVVKIVLEIGFSQVTQHADVRKYLLRGAELCNHQFDQLSAILSKDNLPSPRKWQSDVTNSTTSPFSDKLMLFHIVTLISASAGYYGAGLSVVQRRDLAAQYASLMGEIGVYAEDGANLLIELGWLEQPPRAEDRRALALQK